MLFFTDSGHGDMEIHTDNCEGKFPRNFYDKKKSLEKFNGTSFLYFESLSIRIVRHLNHYRNKRIMDDRFEILPLGQPEDD